MTSSSSHCSMRKRNFINENLGGLNTYLQFVFFSQVMFNRVNDQVCWLLLWTCTDLIGPIV